MFALLTVVLLWKLLLFVMKWGTCGWEDFTTCQLSSKWHTVIFVTHVFHGCHDIDKVYAITGMMEVTSSTGVKSAKETSAANNTRDSSSKEVSRPLHCISCKSLLETLDHISQTFLWFKKSIYLFLKHSSQGVIGVKICGIYCIFAQTLSLGNSYISYSFSV